MGDKDDICNSERGAQAAGMSSSQVNHDVGMFAGKLPGLGADSRAVCGFPMMHVEGLYARHKASLKKSKWTSWTFWTLPCTRSTVPSNRPVLKPATRCSVTAAWERHSGIEPPPQSESTRPVASGAGRPTCPLIGADARHPQRHSSRLTGGLGVWVLPARRLASPAHRIRLDARGAPPAHPRTSGQERLCWIYANLRRGRQKEISAQPPARRPNLVKPVIRRSARPRSQMLAFGSPALVRSAHPGRSSRRVRQRPNPVTFPPEVISVHVGGPV